MRTWQKLFLRTAGIAVGVTVVLAGVVLLVYWYLSQPKSWDTNAISCASASAEAAYNYNPTARAFKKSGFELRFALTNNTSRDYTVAPNVKLFKRQAGTQPLEEFDGKLEHEFLIPAHERAQLTIHADFPCVVSDLDGRHENEWDEPTCYDAAFGDVTGFVALDEVNKV